MRKRHTHIGERKREKEHLWHICDRRRREKRKTEEIAIRGLFATKKKKVPANREREKRKEGEEVLLGVISFRCHSPTFSPPSLFFHRAFL